MCFKLPNFLKWWWETETEEWWINLFFMFLFSEFKNFRKTELSQQLPNQRWVISQRIVKLHVYINVDGENFSFLIGQKDCHSHAKRVQIWITNTNYRLHVSNYTAECLLMMTLSSFNLTIQLNDLQIKARTVKISLVLIHCL